jgi:hypothetical protein
MAARYVPPTFMHSPPSVRNLAIPGKGEVMPALVRADAIVCHEAGRVGMARGNTRGRDGFTGLFTSDDIQIEG